MSTPYLRAVLFSLIAFASSAHAYIALDAIVPLSPMAGETVSARLSDGICDAIIEAEGYPQITQTGSAVRMLLATIHSDDPDFCTSLPGTVDIPFGEFLAGTYTLQVDRHYVDFIGNEVVEAVGAESFVVGGPLQATPLPTLGIGSLVLMGLGMLALAGFVPARRRRSGAAALLMIVLLPPSADAQTDPEPDRHVQVLLSTEPGAPTASLLRSVGYLAIPPGIEHSVQELRASSVT